MARFSDSEPEPSQRFQRTPSCLKGSEGLGGFRGSQGLVPKSHNRPAEVQTEVSLRFLCQGCRESWREFGELFRVPHLSGFGCPNQKTSRNVTPGSKLFTIP